VCWGGGQKIYTFLRRVDGGVGDRELQCGVEGRAGSVSVF